MSPETSTLPTLTVSEKFRSSSPESKSRVKFSNLGLVVSEMWEVAWIPLSLVIGTMSLDCKSLTTSAATVT